MEVQDGGFRGYATGAAVDGLAALARDRERTKRLLIVAVTLLVVVASIAMVFAPAGRQTVAYILGTVLLVMAMGAIGASRFILRAPGVEVRAGETTDISAERGRRSRRTDPPTARARQ